MIQEFTMVVYRAKYKIMICLMYGKYHSFLTSPLQAIEVMQNRPNSSALAVELRLFCFNPSK